MRQYDVVKDKQVKDGYLLVLQSDLFDGANTIVVAPIIESEKMPASIPILLDDKRRVACIPLMAAIKKSQCGQIVTNISHLNTDILAAIDLVFSGY